MMTFEEPNPSFYYPLMQQQGYYEVSHRYQPAPLQEYPYQSDLPQEMSSPTGQYSESFYQGTTTSFDSFFQPPVENDGHKEAAQFCLKLGKDCFQCTICQQTFTRPFNVRGHVMGVHLKKKPHHCLWENCPLSFTRKSDMTRHYRGVHLNIKSRKPKRKYSV